MTTPAWRPEVADETERTCRGEHRWRVTAFTWPGQLTSQCSACGAVEAITAKPNGTGRKKKGKKARR